LEEVKEQALRYDGLPGFLRHCGDHDPSPDARDQLCVPQAILDFGTPIKKSRALKRTVFGVFLVIMIADIAAEGFALSIIHQERSQGTVLNVLLLGTLIVTMSLVALGIVARIWEGTLGGKPTT
jgi:hypothetical protein